jgi:hypothetical protein
VLIIRMNEESVSVDDDLMVLMSLDIDVGVYDDE